MRIAPTFNVAYRALHRNKMRSVVTALGIIIGVGAVIAMVGIGNGAKAQVEAQIASLGENVGRRSEETDNGNFAAGCRSKTAERPGGDDRRSRKRRMGSGTHSRRTAHEPRHDRARYRRKNCRPGGHGHLSLRRGRPVSARRREFAWATKMSVPWPAASRRGRPPDCR